MGILYFTYNKNCRKIYRIKNKNIAMRCIMGCGKALIKCMILLMLVEGSIIFGRSLKEIKARKKITIGLRVRKNVYKKDTVQLHHQISKDFVKFLEKELSVQLQMEYIIAKTVNEVWQDKSGKVRCGEVYDPQFFSKIDFLADVMTVIPWREKIAKPIPYLQVVEGVICNFEDKGVNWNKLSEEKIPFFVAANSNYHQLLLEKKIPNELIITKDITVNNQHEKVKKSKGKACTLLNSQTATLNASESRNLFFIGRATDKIKSLGWWTHRDNKELADLIKKFWLTHYKNEWRKQFKKTYGISLWRYKQVIKVK